MSPWDPGKQFGNIAAKPDEIIAPVQSRADDHILLFKGFKCRRDIHGIIVRTITADEHNTAKSVLKRSPKCPVHSLPQITVTLSGIVQAVTQPLTHLFFAPALVAEFDSTIPGRCTASGT